MHRVIIIFCYFPNIKKSKLEESLLGFSDHDQP